MGANRFYDLTPKHGLKQLLMGILDSHLMNVMSVLLSFRGESSLMLVTNPSSKVPDKETSFDPYITN